MNNNKMPTEENAGGKGKESPECMSSLVKSMNEQAIRNAPLPVNFSVAVRDVAEFMQQHRDKLSGQEQMAVLLLGWYCLYKEEEEFPHAVDAA